MAVVQVSQGFIFSSFADVSGLITVSFGFGLVLLLRGINQILPHATFLFER